MPSGIERRRTQHRRQMSTPAAFDAPTVRPLPATSPLRRHNRTGMSLDLRGLNLEPIHAAQQGHYPEHSLPGPIDTQSFRQEDSTVSITNLGQSPQQTMQVAQPHSKPQPGPQDSFLRSPVQTSLPSPRTPRRTLRAQSPQQPPLSPSKPPTEQQLKDLHEHIQSVYGSCGQVFINILPTPTATPQKPAQLPSHEPLSALPQPPNFTDMTDINLEPTSSAMTFDFENPDVDMGYESSSYYTSDALSPSPISSPHQNSAQPFLEGIEEHQEMMFSQPPALFPSSQSSMLTQGLSLPIDIESFEQPALFNDLEVDASLEYTGIAPEEVQRYISEQHPTTQKWTCLYEDCGKVFGRRENIRSHVQTHLGDRQFRCNGCGKCFVRQHDLKRHAKIHSGNKPYKCPCGAGFARQDALTRHRQRGMCVGGFADAVRRQAKRGRPKKYRPDMEQRVDKASRTRRALVLAPSSSAGSPYSDARSPSPLDGYEPAQSQDLPQLLASSQSFNNIINASADSFSFDNSSSPFAEDTKLVNSSFESSSSYAADVASMNIFQQLSQNSHTPPMSPAELRPHSAGSANGAALLQSSSLKRSSTPSRSSIQSNPFTTPPTSPAEPKDDLDELFNVLPDNSYSQFDLEMKAMGEFTSLDSSSYDLLDFAV
ncbi:BTE binding protein-like protein 4 [Cucurbitaria berberidis CBS 394.84]|uniref:BTE binding protein-like protein 4 n=1 Tax=Cucurbitaria berberidis CBS 394.84 TaxID=1168544 RepID=A0A9P4G7Q8_9PLEO|nr:BTE binding protein-like protein 4 [Cucurbitaria berberidis CBS 394.84]KAF1840279.1 BTE binding protein-like protein 4 [Cucurbitaria berberidis CBS 394.84]